MLPLTSTRRTRSSGSSLCSEAYDGLAPAFVKNPEITCGKPGNGVSISRENFGVDVNLGDFRVEGRNLLGE
jgi:hypothetical protein